MPHRPHNNAGIRERQTLPLPARPWRIWGRALLASSCLTACGLTGCQSANLFSRNTSDDAAQRDSITRALQQSRESNAATAGAASGAAAGPLTVAQHLQLGDQALAEHASHPGRLSEARQHFEEVLRTSPADATAHHRLGVIADLNRDFAGAERHYAQALSKNPRDAQLLHDIGYSYLLQNKPAEAIQYLQQSLAVAPGFEMAARKLADAQVQTGQTESAAQTLRQLLPEPQVQEEIARLQAAQDPASKPSLLGRMRDNLRDVRPDAAPTVDPTQQLLAELQQARAEAEQSRQQRGGPSAAPGYPAANPWGNASQQQQLQYDSQLSTSLAQIDRQGAAAAGRPIYLDAAAGSVPQSAQPGSIPYGAGQFGPGPMTGVQLAGGAALPMISPSTPSPAGDGAVIPAYAAGGPPSGGPAQAGGTQPGFQYAEVIRGTQRGSAAPWEARHFAAQASGSDDIRPAAATVPAGGVASAMYSPQTPTWTAPTFGRGPTTPSGVTTAGQGAAVPSYEMTTAGPLAPAANQGAATAADEYRAAAALGMGAGPGQMFPVIRQTEISSPGTNSLWNGEQFPQPSRDLPIDRPLADLSQAHLLPSQNALLSGPATTPPNSLGQQMPATGQYWTRPDQFASGPSFTQPAAPQMPSGWGTTSGFQLQHAQTPAANPLQTYEQLRAQHDAQLNAAIQQVQGQYPSAGMATPSYGLPVDRPAPGAAMMNNWYPNGSQPAGPTDGRPLVTPEQYPSAPGNVQPAGANYSAPQVVPTANVSASLPPAQYGPNVVVPPAYQSARGQWTQPGVPSGYGSSYAGPTIVPGR